MATTFNKTQLATEVLQELRIVRIAGGAPSDAQREKVLRKYSSILSELRDLEIAVWDEDVIPGRYFEALSQYVAFRCRKAFGVEYDGEDSLRRLRALAAKPDDGEPTRADYF